MDSGNSGSLQSSSGGGDDEFDSSRQGESMSSFFNHVNVGSISAPNQRFLPHQNPNFFDDPIWSVAGLRPPPDQPQSNPVVNSFPTFGGLNSLPPSSSLPIQPQRADFDGGGDGGGGGGSGSSKPPADHHHLTAAMKNPKKRTRASRRAPTTVLTTDTANFRQMVQEFTGIPSSPFGAAASPYTRRLDLFSAPAAAALRLGSGGGHFETLGPLYSLRPQFPPPSSSSSLLNSTMVDSIVPSTNITINPNNSSDHLLTLQNRASTSINPLQFGGFGHHPSGSRTATTTTTNTVRNLNDNDEDDRRWKSGGGNGDDDREEEEQETAAASALDGTIENARHHHQHQNQHQHQHQHQHQISGHSRNFSSSNSNKNNNDILGEKSSMGNGGSSSSPSGPHHQGTLAPWIYPSQ